MSIEHSESIHHVYQVPIRTIYNQVMVGRPTVLARIKMSEVSFPTTSEFRGFLLEMAEFLDGLDAQELQKKVP